MVLDYREDLEIDLSNLHEEWLRQPMLYSQYAEASAEALRQKDLAKNKLEVVKAQLDLAIRSDPAKFELGKITEAAITNTILLQEEYQEVYREYIQAKYEFDILCGVVKSFDQRKTALENEVRLWGAQYFAGPKEPVAIGKTFGDGARELLSKNQLKFLNRDKDLRVYV